MYEQANRVVVVGAGAAGLMASIFAARGGADVTLLEATRDGGRKILISGGGRCNVLPSRLDPRDYITESSPHTLRKILLSWPLTEQRQFFEGDLGIRLALEEETGKLFPISNRARDVRDGLISAAESAGVRFLPDSRVVGIDQTGDGGWRVTTAGSQVMDASRIIPATRGLSVPKTGSDGTGLRILEALGHTIHPTYPALTPLVADPPVHAELAGVSLVATLSAPLRKGRFETTGGFLFTHRGYSGPAVLNISHLAVRSRMAMGEPQTIHVRWTSHDETAWDAMLREGAHPLITIVRRHLPDRLAEQLVAEAGVDPHTPLAQLRREERAKVVAHLAHYPLPWTGDEGYKKAEVTGGGVALSEVDPRTMESRIRPGLFLCGEVLDAFGPIGGYNFAWAWATGRAACRGATLG